MLYKSANYFGKIYQYSIALTRRESGSVTMGFALALINYAFTFVMFMMIMVLLRGRLGVSIRGEFGLYILSGVALFMLHNKIFQEFTQPGKDKQLMPIMAISQGIIILGAILHTVYMQILIIGIFLVGIWIYYGGFSIEYPMLVVWIFFLTVAWSVAISLCAYTIIPLYPELLKRVAMIYRRLGVVTSGKMVPGNMLSGSFHGLFAWNPLFHCIDQIRGAIFLNYTPFNSNLHYPIWATIYGFCLAILLYVALKRFR